MGSMLPYINSTVRILWVSKNPTIQHDPVTIHCGKTPHIDALHLQVRDRHLRRLRIRYEYRLVGFKIKIYGTLKEGPNLWSALLANEGTPGLKPWFSGLKPWIAMVLSSIFLAPEAVDSSVTQLLFTHLPSHQPFCCQDALKFSANTANHTVRTSGVDSPTGLFRAWDTNF